MTEMKRSLGQKLLRERMAEKQQTLEVEVTSPDSSFEPTAPHVWPLLVVTNAAEATEFYKNAFGAVENRAPTKEQKRRAENTEPLVIYASLMVGNAMWGLCDDGTHCTHHAKAPDALKGTTVIINLLVENADDTIARAKEFGAKEVTAAADMFWGCRYGTIVDPFGHEWGIMHNISSRQDPRPQRATLAERKPSA